MKTEEDEAFDDIARRQGAWGGGFQAKRQAAMDKINSHFDEAYKKMHEDRAMYGTSWSKDGERIDPASVYLDESAQEPKFWEMPDGKIVNKWGLQFYNGVVGVALYTTPPKRPWVGLTDEDRKAVLLTAYKEWECEELLLCAREDYLLIEQALKEKNT